MSAAQLCACLRTCFFHTPFCPTDSRLCKMGALVMGNLRTADVADVQERLQAKLGGAAGCAQQPAAPPSSPAARPSPQEGGRALPEGRAAGEGGGL
ncbi:unnamed protein product [Closterium sp. NIES-64]|nr:unnamed protein product [Closterium sp. NIES-64]